MWISNFLSQTHNFKPSTRHWELVDSRGHQVKSHQEPSNRNLTFFQFRRPKKGNCKYTVNCLSFRGSPFNLIWLYYNFCWLNVVNIFFSSSTDKDSLDSSKIPSSEAPPKDETHKPIPFQNSCSATFLDVAVLRCLFITLWQEEGIYWALLFIFNR